MKSIFLPRAFMEVMVQAQEAIKPPMSAPLINIFIGLFIYKEIFCHYTITECYRRTNYILFF